MEEDAFRWDKRWRERSTAEPAPPDALELANYRLPAEGRALDIACGLGGVAVWLASTGLRVDAVDVSSVAVDATNRLAQQHGVANRCSASIADLDGGLPELAERYDVIVCQRFRDQRLYRQLVNRLAAGGTLVITVLSTVGRDNSDSPFLATPGELTEAFAELEVVYAAESDGQAHLIARKPETR